MNSLRRSLATLARARPRVSWTNSAQQPVLPPLPELFNPNFLSELLPGPTYAPTPTVKHAPSAPAPSNPMMDALASASHRAHTTNQAMAYDSTLSPTVDAFNGLRRNLPVSELRKLLDSAWSENPDTALRIIWNLRSIHEGKSERETFYLAFGWLYDKHPRTAISNLHQLVEPVISKGEDKAPLAHGYWKDLLNILALATVDQLHELPQTGSNFLHNRDKSLRRSRQPKEPKQAEPLEYDLKPVIKARRASIGVANRARLAQKLESDPKFRALYIGVARLFADRLVEDLRLLLESETATDADLRTALLRQISLAPKWAPTLRGAHDRVTNISSAVARLIYHARDRLPGYSFPSALQSYERLDDAEPTDILRSFYRRWFLTPLRAATKVTERLMSANQWKQITYSRVSSVCMRNNKDHFFQHDPEGFQKYLLSVEKGQRTIAGATLLPHELVMEVSNLAAELRTSGHMTKYPEIQKRRQERTDMELRIAEAQWNTLVNNLRESGRIENSLAVCDVSGSMGTFGWARTNLKDPEPIYPSLALSLILAQLAKPPFSNGFITFSSTPQFVQLKEGLRLHETLSNMVQSDWGMSTDIEAVFLNLILPLAIQNKIKKEDMIKRLFIFSDMQFDYGTSSTGLWETNYDTIERAFKAVGYDVPEIVYWDLSRGDSEHGQTVEARADRKGVAMLSGFSPSMLKVFMGEEDAQLGG
ncbi:hypothetical protein HMN09_00172700 [Mycena chlorophos]|uniref:Uncharacterized protein n=1 Tax=Mycena chlorophos TaxID=658473 RepID=A0A8H6TQB7_MYCCL|nr:hypothetical protein HMN09_00172700 [Mycena chlorophos]